MDAVYTIGEAVVGAADSINRAHIYSSAERGQNDVTHASVGAHLVDTSDDPRRAVLVRDDLVEEARERHGADPLPIRRAGVETPDRSVLAARDHVIADGARGDTESLTGKIGAIGP